MAGADSESTHVVTTLTICYTTTADRFVKSDLRPDQRQNDREKNPISRPWMKERLFNEAAALKLLADKTTIPVPRVISHGVKDGLPYLELERIHGIVCAEAGEMCRMPGREDHASDGECSKCREIAMANAEKFIHDVVLPQLSTLRSNSMGLNGFIMPPVWVLNHDKRTHWEVKTSDTDEFVFCHGDLVDHNIMCDPKSLEITHLIDLEHSGYLPPECQLWALGRKEYIHLFEDTATLDRLVELIEA